MGEITGLVLNTSFFPLEDATVTVSGDDDLSLVTSSDGIYQFNLIEGNYVITPSKTDNIVNGVSLNDVLTFRRHFTFIESFVSPYQYIAADIDRNGMLSVLDEQLLTNMLMGLEPSLDEEDSWRFVTDAFEIPVIPDFTVSGPIFDYEFEKILNPLTGDLQCDFVGVKVGDIDLSVGDAMGAAAFRSSARELVIDDRSFEEGEILHVVVKTQDQIDIYGLAIELGIDRDAIELLDVFGDGLSGFDSKGNLSLQWYEEERIFVSWIGNMNDTETIGEGEGLLTLTFKAKEAGRLSQVLWMDDMFRNSELAEADFSMSELKLGFEQETVNSESSNGFDIVPNPTRDYSRLQVTFNSNARLPLRVFNSLGELVYQQQFQVKKGVTTLNVANSDFGIESGIYYISIGEGEDAMWRTWIIQR